MSGSEHIELDVSTLLAQSGSMKTLKEDYSAMFSKVVSILGEMNNGWSENLSNNFSGKITTAQKGFAKIVEMLECGENTAKEAATSFEDINNIMARQMSGTFARFRFLKPRLVGIRERTDKRFLSPFVFKHDVSFPRTRGTYRSSRLL